MTNHRAIEARLSAEQRGWLTETCSLLGIDRDTWPAIPWLRLACETIAMQRQAELRHDRGESWNQAYDTVGKLLGIDPASHRRRIREWRALAAESAMEAEFAITRDSETRETERTTDREL